MYGARILFSPKRKPNQTEYMLWTDLVHVTDSSCFLHGPFSFDSHTDIVSAKQFIALQHWDFLLTSFIEFGIIPPPPHHIHSN